MMAVAFRPATFDPWAPGVRTLGQAPASGELGRLLDAAVGALGTEMEAVKVEAGLVSPSALRVEPEKAAQIAVIGGVLGPYEIRSVIVADAAELDSLAARMRTGPLSHYLNADRAAALDRIRTDAAKVREYEQGQDVERVRPEHMAAADDHVQSHVGAVKPLVEAAERLVVAGEAPSVAVREPAERGPTAAEIAVGAGVLAVAGFLLWQLLG